MNWRRAAYALGGGLLGLCIFVVANIIVFITLFQSISFIGGPKEQTFGQVLIVYLVVPVVICAGSAFTARSIGATWRRSLLSGIVAVAIWGVIVEKGGSGLYAVEIPAAVYCAIGTVLTATLLRAETDLTASISTIVLAVFLVLSAFLGIEDAFFGGQCLPGYCFQPLQDYFNEPNLRRNLGPQHPIQWSHPSTLLKTARYMGLQFALGSRHFPLCNCLRCRSDFRLTEFLWPSILDWSEANHFYTGLFGCLCQSRFVRSVSCS